MGAFGGACVALVCGFWGPQLMCSLGEVVAYSCRMCGSRFRAFRLIPPGLRTEAARVALSHEFPPGGRASGGLGACTSRSACRLPTVLLCAARQRSCCPAQMVDGSVHGEASRWAHGRNRLRF